MSEGSAATFTKCRNCGFAAPAGSDEWESVDHPPLGRVTKCPDCGSTDVVDRS
jgi:predicted RNA-binding Zn-ribbon protein involved in translation (DUF1610 family)